MFLMLMEFVGSEDDIKEVKEILSEVFFFTVTSIEQSNYTADLLPTALTAMYVCMNE